jgi:uncharacterized protein YneR
MSKSTKTVKSKKKELKWYDLVILIDTGMEIRLEVREDVYMESIIGNLNLGWMSKRPFCFISTDKENEGTKIIVNDKSVWRLEHLDGSRILGYSTDTR